MIPWVDNYIGIPYKKYGRDRNGVDCYGLVYLVYKEIWKRHDLPDFNNQYDDEKSMQNLIDANVPVLSGEVVTEPVLGDIAVFKFHGLRIHLSIYLEGNKVLHSLHNTETCVESIVSIRMKGRLYGFYRI